MLNDHGNRIRPNYFIMEESLKMGVFIRSLGSTIVVIPPLAICKKDFAFLLDVIYEITQKIEGMV
jgi:adenosylmethionine---8-amino-7-oxononanoate aminotransferase